MGFPVWSRHVSCQGTVKASPGSVNVPVVFGATVIEPGDVVCADDDGVVVVGRAEAEWALERSGQRIANEEATRERLRPASWASTSTGSARRSSNSGSSTSSRPRTSRTAMGAPALSVAVFGLGEAGGALAADLAAAGAVVTGYDPADVPRRAGVRRADDPVDAVAGADLVLARHLRRRCDDRAHPGDRRHPSRPRCMPIWRPRRRTASGSSTPRRSSTVWHSSTWR